MFDELLSSLTVDQLKMRIPALETPERPTRKADIVALVRRHMLSPRIKDYWARLEPMDQHAVAEAVYNWAGRFEATRFANKYPDFPQAFTAGGRDGSRPSQRKANTLLLFFYDNIIPDELRAELRRFVPEPEPDSLKTCPEDEMLEAWRPAGMKHPQESASSSNQVRMRMMETVVRHDLPALLHLVESGAIGISDKTGLATATSIRKIDQILLGGDFYSAEDDGELKKWDPGSLRPIRPYAWPLLLQTGGLAKRNGKKLDLTRKGKKALTAPFTDTVKEIYPRWRDRGLLDEYRRINVVKGQTGKGRRMTAAADRRIAIEAALESCPVGEWVHVDELFRYMQASDHDFEVTHNEWKLYVADSHYGALGYSGYHDFEILQGRYILVYLFEYLATLGMIDVAYVPPYGMRDDYRGMWGAEELGFFSRYDGLLYFRLNPLGAWCLDLSDEYYPVESHVTPLLTVDEDLHIALVRAAEPGELLLLERYAERLSEGRWLLTAGSMLGAMEEGQNPEHFLEFLQARSDPPLGPEVTGFFQEIESRRVALREGGRARLLHCSSVGLARMLASAPETRDHCLHAGGKTLAVPEKTEKAFRQGLRKLGYAFPAG